MNIKPEIDVLEDDESYIVIADLPGIDVKNIEIIAYENEIVIKGFRKNQFNGKFLIIERFSGAFVRKVRFKEYIDTSNAKAVLKDGVLTIQIPKAKNLLILESCIKIVIK